MNKAQKLLRLVGLCESREQKAWVHNKTGKYYVLSGRELEHTDAVDKIGYGSADDPWDDREQALDDGWMRVNFYKNPRVGMEMTVEYRGSPSDNRAIQSVKSYAAKERLYPDSVAWEDDRGNYKFYPSLDLIGRRVSKLAAFR